MGLLDLFKSRPIEAAFREGVADERHCAIGQRCVDSDSLWELSEAKKLADRMGWRDRPPTPEEVKAHGGGWAYRGQLTEGGNIGRPVFVPGFYESMRHPGFDWRPYTHDGDPAPWPEVSDA